MQASATDRVWRRGDWARLIRLFSMGATVVYVPLGMATAGGTVSVGTLPGVVLVGISFHLFAFPLNDVIDLPIDRTNPRRADGPLVRGLVAPGSMLIVALVQVPLMAVLLAVADAGRGAVLSWLMAVAALGAYDLWGKRLPVPLVADLVQGLGFAALVVMGGYWQDRPGPVTWWVAACVAVYIVQINAVHGGVRDIANDAAHGARTTPVLLGCAVDEGGVPLFSRSMISLVALTEIAQIALLVGIGLSVPRSGEAWWALPAVALAARLFAAGLGRQAFVMRSDRSRMMSFGVWHLFWALTAVVVAPLGGSAPWLTVLVLVVYLAPPGLFARLTS
jgi:4-hydroxybenzoate polyprenyltransferase